jgi:hypothetical protein
MTKLMIGFSIVGTAAMLLAVFCFTTDRPILGCVNLVLCGANLIGLMKQ